MATPTMHEVPSPVPQEMLHILTQGHRPQALLLVRVGRERSLDARLLSDSRRFTLTSPDATCPSFFELRVWALLTRDAASLFSEHRAKTATAGLMNKRVQRDRPRANRPGPNFTHLGRIDVDAADGWTTRWLSADVRATVHTLQSG